MSASTPGTGSIPGQDDNGGYQFGLAIIGFVVAAIVSLLVLRFCCNIAIDLCILCDPREALRTTIEFRDRYFPCFNWWRRVAPEVEAVASHAASGRTTTTTAATSGTSVDDLLKSLSVDCRRRVFDALLTGVKLQIHDLHHNHAKIQPQSHDIEAAHNNNSINVPSEAEHESVAVHSCSICLADFGRESLVFVSPPCRHFFHRSCILKWCNGNNTACPYCRQPMVSELEVRSVIADMTGNA